MKRKKTNSKRNNEKFKNLYGIQKKNPKTNADLLITVYNDCFRASAHIYLLNLISFCLFDAKIGKCISYISFHFFFSF